MEKPKLMFLVDYLNNKSNSKSIIKGKTYRFTILTERLIRFEYNKDGIFEDRPTEFAWFRNFPECNFQIKEDNKYLQISTRYFNVEYQKEMPFVGSKLFPASNLKVTLSNTDRTWYYKHPEVRSYGGSNVSLDDFEGTLKLDNGLYSADGFASFDDSESMIINEDGVFEERDSKGIDIYLFAYKKDFGLCLKDYFELTTMPPMIPRYALGNWWSKNIKYSEKDVIKEIETFKDKEIPISVFLLDKKWHIINELNKKKLETGFTFDSKYIPDPKKLTDFLHENNIEVGLNINPKNGIPSTEPKFKILSEYLGITDNLVVFNPKVLKFVEVYLKLFIHPIQNLGFDFFWIDYKPMKEDLNKLSLLNYYHIKDMEKNENIRPLILSRNAKVAPHRYPICYSGRTIVSWNTLKNLPFYNSAAANSGISWWSHDIGGFYKGMEDNELYLRYVQFGTFSPILRFSSDEGKYYKKEPWKLDYKTYEITKDYLKFRYRLIPYIYSESYKYHKTGTPLIQPIYYKVPTLFDDLKVRNQYFLGTQMLIAPIVEKKDNIMNRVIHRFYLPKGVWYDFTTGKRFNGGLDHVSFYKDETYPVFVPAGAIIPLANPKALNDTSVPEVMEIQIFPGATNSYNLYEDDGETNQYKRGFYTITTIEYNYRKNDYAVAIRPTSGKSGIIPQKRKYIVRFKNVKKADTVVAFLNGEQLETIVYEDNNDFVVEINNVSTTEKLILNVRGNDIEMDAGQVINQDIDDIISDLPIETSKKELISDVMFEEIPIKKKRIKVRRLSKIKIDKRFIKLFLKLLEYVETNIDN
ncbi:MAG: DUF5110 domain-containing protein [Bacilli bacterium]|nr:DUF5110 domain-containing protein [Bacilli bacterium]